jgi:hypothetical protein
MDLQVVLPVAIVLLAVLPDHLPAAGPLPVHPVPDVRLAFLGSML